MKDTPFLNKYKYHFLVWSIFIAYELIMERFIGLRLSAVKEYIFAYSLGIFFFYFHAHILLTYAVNTKRAFFKYSIPLLILIELTAYLIISFFGEKYLYTLRDASYANEEPLSLKLLIITKVWRGTYFIGLSTAYYFFKRNLQQKQQIKRMRQQELKTILLEKEVKNELMLTQNAILRAQINPHFLINTLSYLYNETRRSAPKAADSILSLSDIMQYALSKEISSGQVKLENEISLLESFLLLHQAKQTYQVHLELSYTNDALTLHIIPLILMALTEIIIKYGQLDNPHQPAKLRINVDNSILYIQTAHYEVAGNQISFYDSGLKNIRTRLSMAYEEKVGFHYHRDSQNYFHTHIQLQF
ncbi:sensor histidine kinase YesM [Pedobacter cryoconitis]|uniref:Sensor histidine kinase YesM n=1 Tax=Pedobacter cryoconitis TaxID=188932 RepID=A0A7W8ZJV2_9SPHI|nr:sensor histidine kinase [Pedobacter cryoconitis]MBB5635366.1 sensor histidine kinase YesM [Pedobacter cryoconitis]